MGGSGAVWFCALLGLTALLAGAAGPQPREVRPASTTVDESVPRGERPYEMIWANRREAHPPTEPFEDLRGWTVELYGSAQAKLERSHEQVMWGETSAKLTYRGGEGENRIVLRPPQPIPIAGHFTACDLWCHGNNWGWVPRPDTPQVALALLLRDAKGAEHRVGLTRVCWEEWWLVHSRVINHAGADPAFPFTLSGIEITGGHQPQDRVIFFDSLAFYEEEWAALRFEPRPARNLELFPGQTQGLNGTGPERLPFPTREETILPSNLTREFETSARPVSEGAYDFTYRAKDCTLTYRVEPRPSGFAHVEARLDGKRVAAPLDGGGVRADQDAASKTLLARAGLEDGVLTVVQAEPPGGLGLSIEYRYRLWQKSLVVDVICRGGHAAELTLGEFAGVEKPELLPIPYANYGGTSSVLLGRGPGRPWFGSVWVDWYRSNASEMYNAQGISGDRARVNGGVRYGPKTDGRRNDLFERVFLTVSPTYEETLPTIANPPSRWGQVAGECLWQESWGPDNHDQQRERCRKLRAYGIEKLIQCNHEIAWRDNADSFTLRLRAAPKKGGDQALRRYVAAQQALGWRSGLYTNYTDFAPVNENWSPDSVQLASDREWRPAWPRCYALKPSRAVELDAFYAPKIKAKYGSDSAYTDVHTAVAPWGYRDDDARVPGAGTFAATFYAYGELLLNDSRVYGGPIFSEGTYQSLYAGLPDGNYALQYGGLDLARYPLLPQFDLYKMHPLSTDIGMGWTSAFCTWPNWSAPENRSASIDRFLMATMTYGHIGWLVEEDHGIDLACRSYYMLQQLTKRYALTPPTNIRYWEGTKWETTSEAIAGGAYRRSQLRIRYPRLTLYVNGSWTESWRVAEVGELLPPAGWHARGDEGRFLEMSAVREGRRFDYMQSPECLYADGRGEVTFLGAVTVRGGVAVRAPERYTLEVIDTGGNREIGLGVDAKAHQLPPGDVLRELYCASARPHVDAHAFDVDGKDLGPVEARYAQGKTYLMTVPKGVRYVVRLGALPPGRTVTAGHISPLEKGVLLVALPDGNPNVIAGQKVRVRLDVRDPKLAPRADIEGRAAPLEPIGADRLGGVEAALTVPADARPGEALWVRVCTGEGEQTDSGWLFLAVRRPARLSFSPQPAVLRGGVGRVRVTGMLGLGTEAAEAVLEAPDWLSVEPSALRGPEVDRELILRATRPEVGALRVATRFRGTTQTEEFRLVPGTAQPVVVNLYDGSVPFTWGLAVRGGKEQPGDPKTGALFQPEAGISCGGVLHDGLFSHPPYAGGVGYSYAVFAPVTLPTEPCELHLFVGLRDGGDPSDGVDFTVEAIRQDGSEVALLKTNTAERKWTELTADLSALVGQTVRFRLIADVGPNDNSRADWASWGEPTVRLKTPVPTVTIKP